MPKSKYYVFRDDVSQDVPGTPLKVTHTRIEDLSETYKFKLASVNGTRVYHSQISLEGKSSQDLTIKVGKNNQIVKCKIGKTPVSIESICEIEALMIARKKSFHLKLNSNRAASKPYLEEIGSWSGL